MILINKNIIITGNNEVKMASQAVSTFTKTWQDRSPNFKPGTLDVASYTYSQYSATYNIYRSLQEALILDPQAVFYNCGYPYRDPKIGWHLWAGTNDESTRKAEGVFLSYIRQNLQYFQENGLNLCSVGSGECFNELVLLALLAQMGITVRLTCVDRDDEHNLRSAAPAFEHYVKQMSPDSTVDVRICTFESMMQRQPPVGIDAFVSFDALSWNNMRDDLEPYMLASSKPVVSMHVWDKPTLMYSQGNQSPVSQLSFEPTSEIDLRPIFKLSIEKGLR